MKGALISIYAYTRTIESENLLYERVADHITQRLSMEARLHAGERLPSISKLSSQMEVSISTVLQAYMILEDKDWIEAKPQSGFYVRPARNIAARAKGIDAIAACHSRRRERACRAGFSVRA